jgi:protein PhnA
MSIMSLLEKLQNRSGSTCELCAGKQNLTAYEVPPESKGTDYDSALLCDICIDQIENPEKSNSNHWRCLNDSMWNENDVVKVLSWRMLTRLKSEGWTQDLLDMMYFEGDTLNWAKATGEDEDPEEKVIHRDSNGAIIEAGDSVVLIKDLKVSGGGFTAKRGTAVRRVSLVQDNANQIEGRVEDQHIVILTQYVKKL